MHNTVAHNWLKLLQGYAPIVSNQATYAEKVAKIEKRTNTPRIKFEHPAKESFFGALFPDGGGKPKSCLLVGTAGDGKTSLMIEGKEKLEIDPKGEIHRFEEFAIETADGPHSVVFIYDLSAWRGENHITEDQLKVLYRFADSVAGQSGESFVIAANDGRLHQILHDDLPAEIPQTMRDLRRTINQLHARSRTLSTDAEAPFCLRLINLSLIRSEQIMRACLPAILERAEWSDAAFGSGTGLLGPNSSIVRNHALLKTGPAGNRLVILAKLADACGFHLSIRDVLCLIANAILGNPKANKGILSVDAAGDAVATQHADDAPLHKSLFGDFLETSAREKRMCYVFLSLLQIGKETTNELDDLLIFGGIEQEVKDLQEQFETYVSQDPLKQRDKMLSKQAQQYVNGDMTDEEYLELRRVLVCERRRLFLNSSDEAFDKLKLWKSTAFHHAGLYLELLDTLRQGKNPQPKLIRQIIGGLNRIWTGFLLSKDADVLYLCTGLDVTTAAVSDLMLGQIEIDGFNGDAIRVKPDAISELPVLVFDLPMKKDAFSFTLTLQRFEFLIRVANGAMPTSFSRESTEDFAVLKQRCIRDVCKSGGDTLQSINVDANDRLIKTPIHL